MVNEKFLTESKQQRKKLESQIKIGPIPEGYDYVTTRQRAETPKSTFVMKWTRGAVRKTASGVTYWPERFDQNGQI